MAGKVSRREMLATALKAIGALPILGVAGAALGPLVRFFRPTVEPYQYNPPPDVGEGGEVVVATLDELKKPWDFKYFTYELRLPEYTPHGAQFKAVPGAVIRLPDAAGRTVEERLMVCSRICPHLGCIFNFEEDPKGVQQHCGFHPPNPAFCCPCHFSVYDPLQVQDGKRGKVIAGPAPRPPFVFQFRIEGDKIIVFDMEEGSTA